MRIAILSDSHDNIWNLEKAAPFLRGADAILHCGDFIAPFMIVRLHAIQPAAPIHGVFGNNDGDRRLLQLKAQEAGNVFLHGEFAALELDGVKIAMNHYPEIARPLAQSGQYDLVCYGHDHTRHVSQVGETLLVNPGELMGMLGPATLALYETGTKTLEWVTIPA